MTGESPRQPALFVSHGAPLVALDAEKGDAWRNLGEGLPRPAAILVVSAHWEASPVTVGATESLPLIYDFSGFPPALYEVQYRPPGAPALASRVKQLLVGTTVLARPARGLDHGVWTVLVHLFPDARIPVLQLSLPSAWMPDSIFGMGETLAPLRDEGVLLLASGGLTHNLSLLGPDGESPDEEFVAFDRWVCEVLEDHDWGRLSGFRDRAPALKAVHPTEEHLLPLLFAA